MSAKLTILILTFLLVPSMTLAFDWGECPYGNVDDAYPGKCGRFRDLDKDGLCDLSQTRPETRGSTAVAEPISYDKFNIIFITVLILLLYGLSEYLVYLNKNYDDKCWKLFTPKNVRWFWNVVLLWCFIIILISSIVNLLQFYGWLGPTQIKYSFWHVEVGIIMIILCLLHLVKRWRHFVK